MFRLEYNSVSSIFVNDVMTRVSLRELSSLIKLSHLCGSLEKAKPVVRQGRKATGLRDKTAEPPGEPLYSAPFNHRRNRPIVAHDML